MERWHDLVDRFRRNAFVVLQANTGPAPLTLLASLGLAGLHTAACAPGKSSDCPTCSPLFQHLAKRLPVALHTQSVLVCRLKGVRMDENNPPMVLPNGNVYSREGLREEAAASGSFRDPLTGDTFSLSQ